jgi:hypothetical protein
MKFSISFVFLLLASAVYSQSTLNIGMEGYYMFNGNAIDFSGNGYNGLLTGAIPTSDRFGNTGQALFFDGYDDNIELPLSFDYPEMSYVVWFKASSIGPVPGILITSDNYTINNGKLTLQVEESIGFDNLAYRHSGKPGNAAINEGEWYMGAMVRGGGLTQFFLCDSLVGIEPSSTNSSGGGYPFSTIGKSRNNDRFFHGAIDEVRVYSRALTLSEITQLCQSGDSLSQPSALGSLRDNLVSVYPNPVKRDFRIQLKNTDFDRKPVQVSVSDKMGRVLITQQIDDHESSTDISGLPGGVYFVQISLGSEVITKSIIKQ